MAVLEALLLVDVVAMELDTSVVVTGEALDETTVEEEVLGCAEDELEDIIPN